MRYKKRLEALAAEKRAFAQEQKHLRKKYKVREPGIIQVKKKRLLEVIADIIRKVSKVILLTLASVGLIALIYAAPRTELGIIFLEVIDQLHSMIGV